MRATNGAAALGGTAKPAGLDVKWRVVNEGRSGSEGFKRFNWEGLAIRELLGCVHSGLVHRFSGGYG